MSHHTTSIKSHQKQYVGSHEEEHLPTNQFPPTPQHHERPGSKSLYELLKEYFLLLLPPKFRIAPVCQMINPDQAIDTKHPRPLNDYEFEAPNRGLQLNSYSPHDLPIFLHHVLSTRPPLNDEYQKMLSSDIAFTWTADRMKQLLDTWMVLFDDWFFAGRLKDTLKGVNFRRRVGDQCDGYESAHGVYSRYKKKIWIQIIRRSRVQSYMCTYEEYFISVLLHEMVHAFIDLHHCQKSCFMDKGLRLKHASQGCLGQGCHGPPFADSLKILQDALQKSVKWYVWDTLPPSVLQSMKTERWQPREEQLQHWNMRDYFLANLGGWDPDKELAEDP
ncbi:hypothetical protein HYALB_00013514 [Hymenoscyphus albidus]|uniref:SprT-like domain-containing protein n=1 Tax=Hymenoscyphus albidus TaxID=595503 RepID=A0A9N9LVL6_9HELO|nr:hypothetical protein HYALB_00013514 [Hymenoscyphus albidus]